MANRGRKPESLNVNELDKNKPKKGKHGLLVYFDEEDWQWLVKYVAGELGWHIADFVRMAVKNYKDSYKLEIYEYDNKIKEFINQLEKLNEQAEGINKQKEYIQMQIQLYQNQKEEVLKKEEERKKKYEKAVYLIRQKIALEKKTGPRRLKDIYNGTELFKKFTNSLIDMGISARFKDLLGYAMNNYDQFMNLPSEVIVTNYDVKVIDDEAFEKYSKQYEKNNQSETIQNNTSMEPVNNSNNTSVKESSSNEININEIKESESNSENIDIPNETIQENERGQVNFTSTREQIQQENKESKGEYIPSEELIKQEVKQRPKIGKFTIFEDREDICNDLKVHNIIEKREDCSEIKFYKTPTPHYISFKLPKKFNEYTKDQQKYLEDNFDVYSFSPSDPVEINAYVKKEEE